MLLFFRRKPFLPSGAGQLVGVMLLFLIKLSAKKEQMLHSSNSQLENVLGVKCVLLSHTKAVNNMDAVSVISLSGPWTLDYCLMHFKSPAAGE